ncbi:ZSWIM8 [Acrasis kona]|uniref:ZSWIM8 n=1 Tax=Acrasis kona TaxID=1008807 RepID=A0AAW2Z760_9EUKA
MTSNIYPTAPYVPSTNPELHSAVPIQTNLPYKTHPHPFPHDQSAYGYTQPQHPAFIPPQNVTLRVDTKIVPIDMSTHIVSLAKTDLVVSLPEGKNRGEMAILWSLEKNANYQNFTFSTDGFIQSVNNPHMVLDYQTPSQGSTVILNLKKEETDPMVLSQKWNIQSSGVKKSVYIVSALDNNLVLELPGSQQKGLPITLAPRQWNSPASYQMWTLESKPLINYVPVLTDTYFQHVASSNYIDVPKGIVGDAKLVIVHPGKMLFNTNQRWKITKNGFICSSINPEYVLTCTYGNAGERIHLSKKIANGHNLHQRWMILRADNAPYLQIHSMLNHTMLLDNDEGTLQLSQNKFDKNVNTQRWLLKTA